MIEDLPLDIYNDQILKALKEIIDENNIVIDEFEIESRELSSTKIKKKYKHVIDKLFTRTSDEIEELFLLSYGIIDKFNLTPENFVMCLNKKNRLKLRDFADTVKNTTYYKKKETERTEKRRKNKLIYEDF